MKNKRIFSILLAATMLLPLASCGESSDAGSAPAGDTAASDGDLRAEETETEAEPEFVPEQTDMEGFELVILNYTPSAFSWANTLITTEEQNGEILRFTQKGLDNTNPVMGSLIEALEKPETVI